MLRSMKSKRRLVAAAAVAVTLPGAAWAACTPSDQTYELRALAVVSATLGVDEDAVYGSSHFVRDLGQTPETTAELFTALEAEFGVTFDTRGRTYADTFYKLLEVVEIACGG